MKRRDWVRAAGAAGASVFGAGLPFSGIAAQDRYAKYRGKTIVVNYPAHPHYDQAEKLFAEFTAETGIKVERDKLQYLRMKDRQVLEMGKPGGGDFDVVSYVVMWKTEYVAKKLIDELSPYLANPALADPAWEPRDFIESYWQNISLVGGPKGYLPGPGAKPYGVPFGAETSVLAYRADLLAKHNLKPPATYDELLAACRLMKDKEGIGGLTSRGQTGHQVTAAWLFHLAPFGGRVFDAQWRAAFNRPEGIKAAEFLRHVVETGPAGIPAFGVGEMMNAFLQGQAAFYLDTLAIFGPAKDPAKSRVVGQVGYAIHPKAVRHGGETGGFGLAIPSNSKNKEAAFLFIQWMTSKAADKKIARLGGNIGRWSTVNDVDIVRQYPAELPVLREALKIADPDWRPLIPEWDHISQQILGQALPPVLTGRASAKEALDGAVAAAEDVVRKAGLLKG